MKREIVSIDLGFVYDKAAAQTAARKAALSTTAALIVIAACAASAAIIADRLAIMERLGVCLGL